MTTIQKLEITLSREARGAQVVADDEDRQGSILGNHDWAENAGFGVDEMAAFFAHLAEAGEFEDTAKPPVVPIKSQTGPINSTMGKLLWAIQAWFAEMENEERTEAIKAGQARAVANGKKVGRPKVIFDREQVVRLRDEEGLSWSQIAQKVGVSVGTVRRAYGAGKQSCCCTPVST